MMNRKDYQFVTATLINLSIGSNPASAQPGGQQEILLVAKQLSLLKKSLTMGEID